MSGVAWPKSSLLLDGTSGQHKHTHIVKSIPLVHKNIHTGNINQCTPFETPLVNLNTIVKLYHKKSNICQSIWYAT